MKMCFRNTGKKILMGGVLLAAGISFVNAQDIVVRYVNGPDAGKIMPGYYWLHRVYDTSTAYQYDYVSSIVDVTYSGYDFLNNYGAHTTWPHPFEAGGAELRKMSYRGATPWFTNRGIIYSGGVGLHAIRDEVWRFDRLAFCHANHPTYPNFSYARYEMTFGNGVATSTRYLDCNAGNT